MHNLFSRIVISLSLCSLFAFSAHAIGQHQLADSLTAYAAFPSAVPAVRVTSLTVNNNTVSVHTNKVLGGLSLSPTELTALRRQVSLWVLGHPNGKVSIYSEKNELGELITDRYRRRSVHYPLPVTVEGQESKPWTATAGLQSRNIALWPSHGMYYNREQDRWCFQRARMWTMVEDLYTYEFVNTWLVPMLGNAGAQVYEPRAVGDEEAMLPGVSGHPRWMEAARYWMQANGVPDSIWDDNEKPGDPDNDYRDDLFCRGRWVNYLCGGSPAYPRQPGLGIRIDACLALHTDGFTAPVDTDYVGTLVIYSDQNGDKHKTFPTGVSRQVNRDLGDYIQTQIVEDIRSSVEPRWPRRELMNGHYVEARTPEVPTVLLEVLSHKNPADMMLGLNPTFQFIFCRAIYKGLGRWMMGDDFVVQPLPVHALRATVQQETATLSWSATVDSLEPTATPSFYIVRATIVDQNGIFEQLLDTMVYDTQYVFPLALGSRASLTVQAGNSGGLSLISEAVGVRAAQPAPLCLIINHDHRLDGPEWFMDSLRGGIVPGTYPIPYGTSYSYLGDQWIFDKQRDLKDNGWTDDDNCGWGMCHMDYAGQALRGNDFRYCATRALRWGEAIEKDTCMHTMSIDALSERDTLLYDYIEIYCGQENQQLYPAALRRLIERHIAAGKTIVIQGKLLGSALTADERQWAERVLGYRLAAPRGTVPAGRENAPDAIKPAGKNTRVVRRFADTGLPCVLETTSGKARIIIQTIY